VAEFARIQCGGRDVTKLNFSEFSYTPCLRCILHSAFCTLHFPVFPQTCSVRLGGIHWRAWQPGGTAYLTCPSWGTENGSWHALCLGQRGGGPRTSGEF